MKPGDILVMDNLSSHKSEKINQLCHDKNIRIYILPSYSSDLNPIEKLWSNLKQLLRGAQTRAIDVLDKAIAKALEAVTLSDIIRGWYAASGYPTHG